MDAGAIKRKAADWLKRMGAYKFVFLVIAAGLVLLLWPERGTAETVEPVTEGEENFSVEALENKLETVLGQIDGAGEVSVMLTVKSGMERVLARDSTVSETEETMETVVISTGSGKQEVVLLTQRYPTFQGALVVCEGGDDPQVRLLVTQAVAALTGLGSARISVCKGG